MSTKQGFIGHQHRHNNNNNNKRQRQSFDQNRNRRPRRTAHQTSAAAPPPCHVPKCSQCNTEQPKYKCPKCRVSYCSIECCRKHKENYCQACPKEQQQQQNDEKINVSNQERVRKKSKYLPNEELLSTSCDANSRNAILIEKPQNQSNHDGMNNLIDDNNNNNTTSSMYHDDDDDDSDLDPEWKITDEMKSEMSKSTWLHKELQDGGLRQLIWEVCHASKQITRSKTKMTHQEEMLQTMATKYPMFGIFLDKLKVLTGVLERQENSTSCSNKDDATTQDLKHWLEREWNNLGPLCLKPLLRNREASALPVLPTNNDSTCTSDDEDLSSSTSDEESNSSDSSSSGPDTNGL